MASIDSQGGGEIAYETTNSESELQQILALQRDNLPKNISPEEAKAQGFVTIEHDLPILQALSDPYGHIVAKSNDRVVGYALIMLPKHKDLVPFLQPILTEVEAVTLDGSLVKDTQYCVMGQVCISKEFRGRGIFPKLYERVANTMNEAGYDYIITGVAFSNGRSMRAHQKIGFVPLGGEGEGAEYQNIVLRLR